jgi:uncharacterized damage-inducible protein DinB
MFRRIEDFVTEWQEERSATIRLLQLLTDESLSQQVAPGGRTLGFLAWHLVQTFPEMMGHAGLFPGGASFDEPVPQSAAEIAERYQRGSASVLEQVTAAWSDDMLEDEVHAYGMTFRRGFMLDMLIRHEAHHRGQMTVLMRQAGLPVAGPYGPSREQWAEFGMEAHP